jgi:hypothetical protein
LVLSLLLLLKQFLLLLQLLLLKFLLITSALAQSRAHHSSAWICVLGEKRRRNSGKAQRKQIRLHDFAPQS